MPHNGAYQPLLPFLKFMVDSVFIASCVKLTFNKCISYIFIYWSLTPAAGNIGTQKICCLPKIRICVFLKPLHLPKKEMEVKIK